MWWNFHFFCTYLLIVHTRNSIQQPGLARDWTGRIFLGGKGVELDFISCQVCSARWNLVCGASMKYTNTVAPKEEDCKGDDVESMGGSQPRPRQTTPAKQEEQELALAHEWFPVWEMLLHLVDLRLNDVGIAAEWIIWPYHCQWFLTAPTVALQCCAYWWKQLATPLPPSFKECLMLELHPFATDEFDLNICLVDIPILTA